VCFSYLKEFTINLCVSRYMCKKTLQKVCQQLHIKERTIKQCVSFYIYEYKKALLTMCLLLRLYESTINRLSILPYMRKHYKTECHLLHIREITLKTPICM